MTVLPSSTRRCVFGATRRAARATAQRLSHAADGVSIQFRCNGAILWPHYVASLVAPTIGLKLKRRVATRPRISRALDKRPVGRRARPLRPARRALGPARQAQRPDRTKLPRQNHLGVLGSSTATLRSSRRCPSWRGCLHEEHTNEPSRRRRRAAGLTLLEDRSETVPGWKWDCHDKSSSRPQARECVPTR